MNAVRKVFLVLAIAASAVLVDANAALSCFPLRPDVCTTVPDQLSFVPNPVAFPAIPLGDVATQAVAMTNISGADFPVGWISAAGFYGSFSASHDCPTTLAAGSSCTITVRFAPAKAGSGTGMLTVYRRSGSPAEFLIFHDVVLSASAMGGGVAVVQAPSAVEFASQIMGARGPAQTVELKNAGDAPLQVSALDTAIDFGVESTSCNSAVAPGSSCIVLVYFLPTAAGDRTGTLRINSNASNAIVEVALHGVGMPPPPTANLTGLWWYPAESGWGLTLTHQGDRLFATMFTYVDGTAKWLFASDMRWTVDGTFASPLYAVASGPPFDAAQWTNPSGSQVGSISVAPTAQGSLTLRYSVGASTIVRTVTPIALALPMPVCTAKVASRVDVTNYTDLWWNPSESGWGLYLTHQGDVVFANLYTFDHQGNNAWYFASELRRQADGSYSGDLYEPILAPAHGDAWPGIVPQRVGGMTLRFPHGESALADFSINGRAVHKEVSRLVFDPLVPVCR